MPLEAASSGHTPSPLPHCSPSGQPSRPGCPAGLFPTECPDIQGICWEWPEPGTVGPALLGHRWAPTTGHLSSGLISHSVSPLTCDSATPGPAKALLVAGRPELQSRFPRTVPRWPLLQPLMKRPQAVPPPLDRVLLLTLGLHTIRPAALPVCPQAWSVSGRTEDMGGVSGGPLGHCPGRSPSCAHAGVERGILGWRGAGQAGLPSPSQAGNWAATHARRGEELWSLGSPKSRPSPHPAAQTWTSHVRQHRCDVSGTQPRAGVPGGQGGCATSRGARSHPRPALPTS